MAKLVDAQSFSEGHQAGRRELAEHVLSILDWIDSDSHHDDVVLLRKQMREILDGHKNQKSENN